MPLLLQDLIVTAMALGAVGLVVRRVVGVFSPPPAAPPCTACASCPAPRTPPADESKPVPVSIVTRPAAERHPGRP